MFDELRFARVIGAVLALSFIIGFAVYVLLGTTTNKGTTDAIAAESAAIMRAEKASCTKFGTYASISTLRKERLLRFEPLYNSVVFLPGKHCGTITVGSPAYQLPAG